MLVETVRQNILSLSPDERARFFFAYCERRKADLAKPPEWEAKKLKKSEEKSKVKKKPRKRKPKEKTIKLTPEAIALLKEAGLI